MCGTVLLHVWHRATWGAGGASGCLMNTVTSSFVGGEGDRVHATEDCSRWWGHVNGPRICVPDAEIRCGKVSGAGALAADIP